MDAEGRISLAIVDDHRLFREGLAAVFRTDGQFVLVAQGGSGEDAVSIATSFPTHVMLLDVEMGGAPVATTMRKVLRIRPAMKVVILTMYDDAVLKRELLALGAAAFLSKVVPSSQLLQTVRDVSRLPVSRGCNSDEGPGAVPSLLSPRERQVLELIARALSNAEIAQNLTISEGTVKRHVSNLYTKLGAHSRMEAVRRARHLALL